MAERGDRRRAREPERGDVAARAAVAPITGLDGDVPRGSHAVDRGSDRTDDGAASRRGRAVDAGIAREERARRILGDQTGSEYGTTLPGRPTLGAAHEGELAIAAVAGAQDSVAQIA